LSIERVPLTELVEDPENYRIHPEDNLATIRHSLKTFGQVEPLVVQKGTNRIIGGNGRLRAMRELGWPEVDVVRVDVSEEQAKLLGVTLNRTAELAEWDTGRLLKYLDGLDEELFKNLLAFDVEEFIQPEIEEKEFVHKNDIPDGGEKFVQFKFGEYSGLIDKEIYDRFVTVVAEMRSCGRTVMLADVVRGWVMGESWAS
jgi:hypothetical protein